MIFFIWTHAESSLHKFIEEFNNFHPNFNFSYGSNKENINFLDLAVHLSNGKLVTVLYTKPTDCHQYLHYTSSHLEHTKRSVVFRQTLSVSRICSLEKDFQRHEEEMKSCFLRCRYLIKIIENEMKKVKFSNFSNQKNESDSKGISFVLTYHPALKSLGKIIEDHLHLLYMNN